MAIERLCDESGAAFGFRITRLDKRRVSPQLIEAGVVCQMAPFTPLIVTDAALKAAKAEHILDDLLAQAPAAGVTAAGGGSDALDGYIAAICSRY